MSRRKWVFDEETKELVEVTPDYDGAERRAPVGTEELTYGGMRATDGADISSKRKLREYLRATGLTLADDYKQTWAKAAEERGKAYTAQDPVRRKEIREAVGRAAYELEKKGRR